MRTKRTNQTNPKRLANLLWLLAAACALVIFGRGTALASETSGGRLEALIDGERVALPVFKTDMSAHLQGDLATVRLTQVFQNPYSEPLHARYIFPLPPDAAVYAMRLISGDQMIEAEIRRKQEARAIFEAAKTRGSQAALLSQERPNVFTQEVANLLPGAPISVTLEYAHVVEKQHGTYRFHFPMVVGPRYLAAPQPGQSGAPTGQAGEPEALAMGIWNLPGSPPVAAPETIDPGRVRIQLQLDAGIPIVWMESPSHQIAVERVSATLAEIGLAEGGTVDNKDFVLHYELAGEAVTAGATTYLEDGQGFVSLLLEPPASARAEQITPRELVFVLDCSGSMSGTPLEASKRFMRRSLPKLRPSDWFRIIRFSDAASEWTAAPVPATQENVRAGLRYVASLYGSGGTVMTSGIRRALAPPVPEDAIRLVVFLTDGYIGNDVEIVRLIQQERGEARFFSFGIGSSVNRYLIREMARVGRGAARIVLPSEDADLAADELADRLAAPVLTDVEIDWSETPVFDAFPRELPDLFLGQSLRVMGRFTEAGTYPVTVRGKIAGHPVSLPVELALPRQQSGIGGDALPILWARAQIEDRMTSFMNPAVSAAERERFQEEVTELGLAHRLVTQWTSFVAVARAVVNPGGWGPTGDVAVPQVEGVSELAYPPSALPGNGNTNGPKSNSLLAAGPVNVLSGSEFQGNAAPEPATWVALAALALVAGVFLRGQRRNSYNVWEREL